MEKVRKKNVNVGTSINCTRKYWTANYLSMLVIGSVIIVTRIFRKLDEIGNNANICIRGFTT